MIAEARAEVTRGDDVARLEAELVALRRVCADLTGELADERRHHEHDQRAIKAGREANARLEARIDEVLTAYGAARAAPAWVEWSGTWLLVENKRVIADISEDGEPPRVLWAVEGAGQGLARDAATGRRIVEAVIAAEKAS